MAPSWKRELRSQIRREHARTQREQLAKLRDAIRHAKADRKRALLHARERCKVDRAALRVRLREKRARILQQLKRIATRERQAARDACRAGVKEARGKRTAVERSRHELHAERQYRRELRRIEQGQRAALHEHKRASAAERRSESDDEVAQNIPSSYRSLWKRVKGAIKSSPRRSRTEAFMQYAEEHPDEILESLDDATDRLVADLERREREAAKRLRRGPEPSAYADVAPF